MTDRDRRISDQLVRMVQIVFGLVLAQGLLLNQEVILHPFNEKNIVPLCALASIFIMTFFSWVDWHTTMELNPYNVNTHYHYRYAELMRLGLDLLVVIVYAYLLFSIEEIKKSPTEGISSFLLGFIFIFILYFFSGLTRIITYGRVASKLRLITVFGLLYLLLYVEYGRIDNYLSQQNRHFITLDFLTAIVFALFIMITYRVTRYMAKKRDRKKRKESGLLVGIDIDGVLANQIYGIIPRVLIRLGISLSYEDVVEWELPLGESDIASEIFLALEDKNYVLGMPVHDGAQEGVDKLFSMNKVMIITGRPPSTRQFTEQWLLNNGFSYDELVHAKEGNKSSHRPDVLIDDFIGNIREYLENSNGKAILIDQPWNRERNGLHNFIEEKQLFIVNNILEAVPIIELLRQKRL